MRQNDWSEITDGEVDQDPTPLMVYQSTGSQWHVNAMCAMCAVDVGNHTTD